MDGPARTRPPRRNVAFVRVFPALVVLALLPVLASCGGGGGGGATGVVPPVVIDSPGASSPGSVSPAPTSVASVQPLVTPAVPTASTSPTAKTSASPSFNSGPLPEPTVAVSGTPAAGDRSDRAVLAAARAYVTALDVGFRTGDERPFLTMTADACDCRKLYLPTFARQRRDRVMTSIRSEVTEAAITSRQERPASVLLKTANAEYQVTYPDGRMTRGEPAKGDIVLDLQVEDGRWIVRRTR